MATTEIATGGNTAIPPVACALTAAKLTAQVGRWRRVATAAMTDRIETATGLRIRFRAEPGIEEELRSLVEVENECCPWASWTVHATANQVVLDVSSARDGIAALHDMFTGPHAAQ
jgi:hypothetical protein